VRVRDPCARWPVALAMAAVEVTHRGRPPARARAACPLALARFLPIASEIPFLLPANGAKRVRYNSRALSKWPLIYAGMGEGVVGAVCVRRWMATCGEPFVRRSEMLWRGEVGRGRQKERQGRHASERASRSKNAKKARALRDRGMTSEGLLLVLLALNRDYG